MNSPRNSPVNPFKYPIAEKLKSEFEKLESRRNTRVQTRRIASRC